MVAEWTLTAAAAALTVSNDSSGILLTLFTSLCTPHPDSESILRGSQAYSRPPAMRSRTDAMSMRVFSSSSCS
jgi:hypothetical protein